MNKYVLHDVFLSYRRFEDEARTDAQGTEIAETIYHYTNTAPLWTNGDSIKSPDPPKQKGPLKTKGKEHNRQILTK